MLIYVSFAKHKYWLLIRGISHMFKYTNDHLFDTDNESKLDLYTCSDKSKNVKKKRQMTENKFNKWWLMREGPPALSVGVEFLFYLTICYLAPFLIHSQYSIPSETRYGRVVHQRSTNTEAILDYIIKHIRCKMSDMVLFGYTLCVL